MPSWCNYYRMRGNAFDWCDIRDKLFANISHPIYLIVQCICGLIQSYHTSYFWRVHVNAIEPLVMVIRAVPVTGVLPVHKEWRRKWKSLWKLDIIGGLALQLRSGWSHQLQSTYFDTHSIQVHNSQTKNNWTIWPSFNSVTLLQSILTYAIYV